MTTDNCGGSPGKPNWKHPFLPAGTKAGDWHQQLKHCIENGCWRCPGCADCALTKCPTCGSENGVPMWKAPINEGVCVESEQWHPNTTIGHSQLSRCQPCPTCSAKRAKAHHTDPATERAETEDYALRAARRIAYARNSEVNRAAAIIRDAVEPELAKLRAQLAEIEGYTLKERNR